MSNANTKPTAPKSTKKAPAPPVTVQPREMPYTGNSYASRMESEGLDSSSLGHSAYFDMLMNG